MSSKRPSPKQRRSVEERARQSCEYCLSPNFLSSQTFNVDHVVPESKGGKTELDNLALACGCNDYKASRTHARDPQTGQLAPLFNPRQQQWAEHFAWSDDKFLILGLTATGRATIEALRMNREELIHLRRALIAIGKHPADSK